MRRLTLPEPGVLAWRQVAARPLRPDEFRVRTTLTAISAGTEISKYRGTLPGGVTSWEKLGYQLVGVVTEVGPRVQGVVLGDRVFAHAPHADESIIDSDMGRYYVLQPDVADEDALISGLATVAVQGARRVGLQAGHTVCVVGLGTLGMTFLQLALALGAPIVIGCDIQPDKLRLASSLGASHVVAPSAELEHIVQKITGTVGVDIAVEAVGESSSTGFRTALRVADVGGSVLALSGTLANVSSGETISVKELSIIGTRSDGGASSTGKPTVETTRRAQENLRYAGRLVTAGMIRGQPLVSHRYPATSVEDAYRMIDGRSEGFTLVVLEWG